MAVLRIHAPVLGQQERVFEWDGRPILIGRDDACDVVLLEQAASRHHARLERHGDEIRLLDCDSANGVWVGDERVVGSRVLLDGEVIRIGDTTLALVLDPHRQPTLYREPGSGSPGLERAATVAQVEAATPVPLAVSSPTPPAVVPPRAPAPVVVPLHASSPSAYSIGSEPTIAGESGPNLLGVPDRSAPSVYSLGEADTIVPHAEPSALGRPLASSSSVYSLGNDVHVPSHEPETFGRLLASSSSVYSLGRDVAAPSREPDAFGGLLPSSSSVYSLGDASPAEFRGPDVRLPPAPAFDGAVSSEDLGPPPPRPALLSPPRSFEAARPRPPVVIPPPSPRSAASSWKWAEPAPSLRRHRSGAARAALWLGVVLFLGGVVAITAALAAGYEPSELASQLSAAAAPGGPQ